MKKYDHIKILLSIQKFIHESKAPVTPAEIIKKAGELNKNSFTVVKGFGIRHFNLEIVKHGNSYVKMTFCPRRVPNQIPYIKKDIDWKTQLVKEKTWDLITKIMDIVYQEDTTLPEISSKTETTLNEVKNAFLVIKRIGGLITLKSHKITRIDADLSRILFYTPHHKNNPKGVNLKPKPNKYNAPVKNKHNAPNAPVKNKKADGLQSTAQKTINRLKKTVFLGDATHTELREFREAEIFLKKYA